MKTESLKFRNPKDDIANANLGQLETLKLERALFLEKHKLTGPIGDDQIRTCDDFIKIGGVPLISEKPITINKSALCKLYYASNNLRISPADVLGLKIILGANDDNTMHLFYQPICMTLKDELFDAELQKQGIYQIGSEGAIYDYYASDFYPSELAHHAVTYKERVKIAHDYDDDFTSFITGKDVESAIFSFQEVFAFIHGMSFDHVDIYNCARKIYTGDETYDIKHSIILGSEKRVRQREGNTLKIQLINDFKAAYANLTHLCPPNCMRFLYPLES